MANTAVLNGSAADELITMNTYGPTVDLDTGVFYVRRVGETSRRRRVRRV